MEKLKAILGSGEMGYRVIESAKCFQFERELRPGMTVRIDLLAAPPPDEDLSKVTIKAPRIRPRSVSKIHGRLTQEAASVHMGKVPIELGAYLGRSDESTSGVVYIPSSLNYLILKLHALRDRKERLDSDKGRHHAFDIFRIVADMRRSDWASAEELVRLKRREPHVRCAAALQREYFGDIESVGVVRLRENVGFLGEFESCLENLIEDMAELFAEIEPRDYM
ncbi:MAG: hypothetical protein AAGI01_12935 [Myxococcota bacterium]